MALRHPVTKLWHGFVAHALILEPIAAVLSYSVMSRILVALTNRVLGMPSYVTWSTLHL